MATLFLSLFDFFRKRKTIFWIAFVAVVALISAGASRIHLEEDITRFFPDDPRMENLQEVFQHSKFVERIVVMVSVRDSSTAAQPDTLTQVTEQLVDSLGQSLQPFVSSISARVDDERILAVYKTIHEHLPVFLDDNDYAGLDSLSDPEHTAAILEANYRQLISPSGVALKRIIADDPLGFSFLVLSKLRDLQYDRNFELYDSYIMTRDRRHLIFFIEPRYTTGQTGNNTVLMERVSNTVGQIEEMHPAIQVSYFGAPVVAVDNAVQLRRDSILTVSIMLVLLCVFLIGFFRKKRVPFLILIPVAFGGLFSMCCVYVIQGSVSILALAAGSIILGIAVNYALHFLVHLRHSHNVREVIAELVNPLTLGSATTVLAFLCLQFTNASVLRDVGLFAAFSLVGAAFCTLVFLPHLVTERLFANGRLKESLGENLFSGSAGAEKIVVWIILLATPVFFYFAGGVTFNSDMGKLNYMTEQTREAQERLEKINQASLGTVYVVSRGQDLEHALRKAENILPVLRSAQNDKIISKFISPALLLVSDSLQQLRIRKWNAFWNESRKSASIRAVRDEGQRLKFSGKVIANYEQLIGREYRSADSSAIKPIRKTFFDDYLIERDGSATVISLANAGVAERNALYDRLKGTQSAGVDRRMLTNLFVEYVHADFNFIVMVTAILVFLALFISYGRIEITLITFAPMFLTWIWILGIMALLGIEFNIINVMISTFIFGLGDDYSIFIMDGLQQEYRSGRKSLPSIRTSILLSAVTTIAGLGVLIFARHPALQSIASISIIGIVCVFIMSQTIEPFLFRYLITNRTSRGFPPMTWAGILRTLFTYTYFVSGALVLTVIGLLLKLLPAPRKDKRYIFHALLSWINRSLIRLAIGLKVSIRGRNRETFATSRVIIANHSSFLDILVTTMLTPKLILLTNRWVWNSPVFGRVVRFADYYPVTEGAEESIERLNDRVREGYSVVVFPEGKRSEQGHIGRFHKGAFYLAEALQIPVQPLLIHGAWDGIPKGTFYLSKSYLALKFLPPIAPGDDRFGLTYAERTKAISRYFKTEFSSFDKEMRRPPYFVNRLITNYLYKGPVLEWYLRIKLRLENNYEIFDSLLPQRGHILDLGCGYGFLCYMLQFLSEERMITGVDYDEEKIETAQFGYARTERLNFIHSDVTGFPLATYSGIVISDVLHYLQPEAQDDLLLRCFDALEPGGVLIIRDGNADLKERHQGTRLTEFFSVRLFRFNKSVNTLNFVSGERIRSLAKSHKMNVTVLDDSRFTSNMVFVIRKHE